MAVHKPAQVVGQVPGGGESPRRVFFQALQANRLQVKRHPRFQLARGTGSCPMTWRMVSIGLLALNGGRPIKQLVKDRAQRINVRGRTDLAVMPLRLFGRHVTRCAENGAGLRVARFTIDPLGQPEIRDLGRSGP